MMNKGFAGITELADADYTEVLRFPVWLDKVQFYDEAHDFVLTEAAQRMEQYLQISSLKFTEQSAKDIRRYTITGRIILLREGKIINDFVKEWEYEIFPYTKKMFTYEKYGADQHLVCIYVPTYEGDTGYAYVDVRMNRRAGELAWWLCNHTNFYYGSYIHNDKDEQHLFQLEETSKKVAPVQHSQSNHPKAIAASNTRKSTWKIAVLIAIILLGACYASSHYRSSSSTAGKKPAVAQQAHSPASNKKSGENKKTSEKKAKVEHAARSGVVTGYNPSEPVLNDSGLCEVTIDNTKNDMPVYVRIWDADAVIPVRSFYIRQGGQFTADNLDPGTYQVRYIDLYEDGTASRGSKSENFELEQIETFDGTQYSRLSLTLYKVRNGNTRTTSIDADDI